MDKHPVRTIPLCLTMCSLLPPFRLALNVQTRRCHIRFKALTVDLVEPDLAIFGTGAMYEEPASDSSRKALSNDGVRGLGMVGMVIGRGDALTLDSSLPCSSRVPSAHVLLRGDDAEAARGLCAARGVDTSGTESDGDTPVESERFFACTWCVNASQSLDAGATDLNAAGRGSVERFSDSGDDSQASAITTTSTGPTYLPPIGTESSMTLTRDSRILCAGEPVKAYRFIVAIGVFSRPEFSCLVQGRGCPEDRAASRED